MPPKGRGAPKPVEFHVAQLQAGKKQWTAGGSGPPVKFSSNSIGGGGTSRLKKEVVVVGKALFGRGRFAFEVQEIDYSPAAIKKVLKKEKELQDTRFGHSGGFYGFGGFGDANSDEEKHTAKNGSVDVFEAVRASELFPKHSIQVKFDDIDRIETANGAITLILSKAPQCYVKPLGEPRIVNMETTRDITGGAKRITFITGTPQALDSTRWVRSSDSGAISFSEVQRLVTHTSPRLAALFAGLPPPVASVGEAATPKRKRKKISDDVVEGSSSTKQARRGSSCFVEEITVPSGTWLEKAVQRFGLKGIVDKTVSEEQWKMYFSTRVLLELKEAASLKGDGKDMDSEGEDEHENVSMFKDATWPEEMDPGPEIQGMSFESYKASAEEERQFAADIISQIRASVKATVVSSSLQLDPEVVARGVFLRSYHINDADEGEPRTVNSSARIYAPNGTGCFVDLVYENHKRVRMSFTERHSCLQAVRGGPAIHERKAEKIFEMSFDEHRRKNQTKSSLASNAVLCSLGAHLFGADEAMSNRKVFGILVRAAGLGKFGENNGWPIAVARRRFKCGKGEEDTDTERIAGEKSEEADIDGCCMM